MSIKRPHVYMDIAIGQKPAGRIVFELFIDITPQTCENFRGLCTGEYDKELDFDKKSLFYRDTQFYEISKNKFIKGGDVEKNNGEGKQSVFGGCFNDENFEVKHNQRGLLSTVFQGKDGNNSSFMISLDSLAQLDGKQVVFGQIVYGLEVLDIIQDIRVDSKGLPVIPVVIMDCGEIGDSNIFLTKDPLGHIGLKKIRDANRFNRLFFEEVKEENLDLKKQQDQNEQQESDQEEQNVEQQIELEKEFVNNSKLSETKQKRLLELKMRIERMKQKNIEQVLEEQRMNNPEYVKQFKTNMRRKQLQQKAEELQDKNLTNVEYLNKSYSQLKKKIKKNKNFGWNIFNKKYLFKAHQNRVKTFPIDEEKYKTVKKESEKSDKMEDNQDRKDLVVKYLNKKTQKNKSFSRRRKYDPDKQKYFVNERNRVFNQRLYRYFGSIDELKKKFNNQFSQRYNQIINNKIYNGQLQELFNHKLSIFR